MIIPFQARCFAPVRTLRCAATLALCLLVSMPFPAAAGDNRWTSGGPYGGGIFAFTFHPENRNLIFAAGSYGQYRSRDAGTTWQPLDLPFDSYTVRIHPSNPGTMIAAGWSVYFSTDEGTTWSLLSTHPFGEYGRTWVLEFHPADPNTLYAYGSGYKGFCKSTDGGKKWVGSNNGLPQPQEFGQIEVDPTNGETVYVLVSGRVYKSTNGGSSWKLTSKGLPVSDDAWDIIEIDPENPSVLYWGSAEGIYKTTNGGSSWVSTNCGCYSWTLTVDPQDSRIVYSAYDDTIIRSTDRGASWTEVKVPGLANAQRFFDVAVHPISGTLLLGGAPFGICRSTNRGKNWEVVNEGLNDTAVDRLGLSAQMSGRAFVRGSPGVLYQTRDRGKKWSLVRSLVPYLVSDVKLHPENSSIVVAAIWSGGSPSAAVSVNGGKNWRFSGSLYDAYRVALDPRDSRTIYIGSFYDGVVKSTDQGMTWVPANVGLTDLGIYTLLVDPANSSILYAGAVSGRIFKSTDGGSSWAERSAGLTGEDAWITIGPAGGNTVYAVTGDGFFKSTDGGQQWQAKNSGLGGFPFLRFVAVNPGDPETVYTGGHGVLFVSTDSGESWSVLDSTGLQGIGGIWDFAVSAADPSTFYIGTDGGVYSFTRKGLPGGPVIEQVVPAEGKVGDLVTINGRKFGASQGNNTVTFGSIAAGAAQAWSDTQIATRVPAGALTGPVVVSVASRASNPFDFIVLPTSGKIEPSSGPSAGGTRVAIVAPAMVSENVRFNVFFGTTLAMDVRFTPPSTITCVTPPGTGTVDVRVTTELTSAQIGTFSYK